MKDVIIGNIPKWVTRNGWTREAMKERIREGNTGTRSGVLRGLAPDGQAFNCMYRAPDGNQCGAGCFIPDADYHPDMDDRNALAMRSPHPEGYNSVANTGIRTVLACFPELQEKMPLSEDGMSHLQSVHDGCHDGEDPRISMCRWIDGNVIEPVEAS